jgi:hypothetical protein
MIALIVIAVLAAVIGSMTGFAARRHAMRQERETADNAAIHDLYDHYRNGIEALIQAYLLEGQAAPSTWLVQSATATLDAIGRLGERPVLLLLSRYAWPRRSRRLAATVLHAARNGLGVDVTFVVEFNETASNSRPRRITIRSAAAN